MVRGWQNGPEGRGQGTSEPGDQEDESAPYSKYSVKSLEGFQKEGDTFRLSGNGGDLCEQHKF